MTGMELHLGLGLVRSPRAWISKTLEWATPPQGTPAAPRPSLQHPHPLPAVRSVAHKHLRNQFSELPFSCLEQGCGRSPLRGGCSHGIQGIGRLAVSAQGSLRSRQGDWSFTTGARSRVTNSQAVPRPRKRDTSSALASKFFLEQESPQGYVALARYRSRGGHCRQREQLDQKPEDGKEDRELGETRDTERPNSRGWPWPQSTPLLGQGVRPQQWNHKG